MKKYLAIAAMSALVTVAAPSQQANAGVVYTGHAPWLIKAAAITVGVMTTSVMLNAIIVSNQQKRQLTLEEGQYAAFLPFLWVVRPLPPAAPARKR